MERLNITIPEDLAIQLDSLVTPRKKSKFIVEAIREKIHEVKKRLLEQQLEEGYNQRKKEGLSITKEFEAADLESWDEY